MAWLLNIDSKTHQERLVTYFSEPSLAWAACSGLLDDESLGSLTEALAIVKTHYLCGHLDKGNMGELVCRLLLLTAIYVPRVELTLKTIHSLQHFLGRLVGFPEGNGPLEPVMLAIHSLFEEVTVTFSHFAKLDYRAVVCDTIDQDMVINGLWRNVTWSCPTNFPGIDVIIPCLVKGNGSRRYGYIGVQFKNHNTSSMKSPDEKMRSMVLTEEVGANVINVCNIVMQVGKPTEYSVVDQRTAQQEGKADVFIGRDSRAKRQRSSGTRTEPADERIMLWKSRNLLACISSSYREHLQKGDGSSANRPLPLTLYIMGMESFTTLLGGSSSVSNILNDLLLINSSMHIRK